MVRKEFGPVSLGILVLAPVSVVAMIVWIIVAANPGESAQTFEPKGAGAGDTGGANAIGEALAGNDAEEIERQANEQRRGRTRDPLVWPDGFELVIHDRALGLSSEDMGVTPELILWPGVETPESAWQRIDFEPTGDGRWSAVVERDRVREFMNFRQGATGGGIHVSVGTPVVAERALHGPGGALRPIRLPPVVVPSGQDGPLRVELDLRSIYVSG